jgi:ATP-dependent DNA helicase DinG
LPISAQPPAPLSAPSNSPAKLPTLHAFFAPGGVLAQSPLPFEFRKGQLDMAQAVERALTERKHLIVEAGTGTGKTLAYLLPALRTGQRVIISTGTKNLQEQLFFKDIPFLESLLGPLRVCYMKGRANYLCRHKLYALANTPILNGLEEIDQVQKIATWEKTTVTGDRAEIDGLPENSQLWHKLDARTEACLGSSCPNYENCFITEMRRKAAESDIIIVNHHLFFADLAIRQKSTNAPDVGILPEAFAVIFDEAHELEDIAGSYFGIGLSNVRFEELVRDLEATLRNKQALSAGITSSAQLVRERARMFFGALPQPPGSNFDNRMPFEGRDDFLETYGDLYLGVTNALHRLEGELDRVRGVEEAAGLKKRTADIRDHLKFLMEAEDRNTVFWIERRASGPLRNAARNVYLQATPIDVSAILDTTLFENFASVILTSATLTIEGGFEHLRNRLGMKEAREMIVPSHFRYSEQVVLYLPPDMPDPRDPTFTTEATRRIRRILEITRGRAFCLFTSYAQMRDVHDRLLAELDYPLLLQGSAPKKALLEEFRITPNAVLFGTSSFWQGVDVQGEALSCVIIDKLPFAVPSDPVVAARMRAIESEGRSPFFEYQVPQAVITLKQGFGRLIRSLEDRGVLCLLDPRLQRQRYGKVFLDSLPPYRITHDIAAVEDFFKQERVSP